MEVGDNKEIGLPNWIFKAGIDRNGEINYEVNGAFIYLSEEEMNKFRCTIMEAIFEAEKFYHTNKPAKW